MINANYQVKNLINPEKDMKAKLLKKKFNPEDQSVEEIDSMLNAANPKKENDYEKRKADAITGGNYDEIAKPIAPSILDGGKEVNSDSKWGTGSGGAKAGSAAMGALGMASTVMAQKGPMNGKERGAMAVNLASQGAQAGAAFGPTGMAIGAAAGLLTGGIMAIGDQKELDNKAKIERVAMLDDIKDKRMKSQKLEEGKKAVAKNKSLLEAQMGMLGSNYSPSKTV